MPLNSLGMEELSLKASRMPQKKSNGGHLQGRGEASLDMVSRDSLSKDGTVKHTLYARRIKIITLPDNPTIAKNTLATCSLAEQRPRKVLQRHSSFCSKDASGAPMAQRFLVYFACGNEDALIATLSLMILIRLPCFIDLHESQISD
jgi:hypothetical protein